MNMSETRASFSKKRFPNSCLPNENANERLKTIFFSAVFYGCSDLPMRRPAHHYFCPVEKCGGKREIEELKQV